MHGLEIEGAAEGDGREDGELVGGIDAVDIKAGVGLGVAQRLRLGEHRLELTAGVAHAGEDVVAGAVEDAEHLATLVADQALAQGLDDRDAAGNGRLVGKRDAVGFRGGCQCHAVMGDQCLVGGDHVAARRQRPLAHGSRRSLRAADQLDDDVGIGFGNHADGIVIPAVTVDRIVARAVVFVADGGDEDRAAEPLRQPVGILLQELDRAAADRAQTRNCDLEWRSHPRALPVLPGRHLAAASCSSARSSTL